jgi:hypothetical protein
MSVHPCVHESGAGVSCKYDWAFARIKSLEQAFMSVIQIENLCQKTGAPCRERHKCGCALEMDAEIEEYGK